jgi:hypothetical protein
MIWVEVICKVVYVSGDIFEVISSYFRNILFVGVPKVIYELRKSVSKLSLR